MTRTTRHVSARCYVIIMTDEEHRMYLNAIGMADAEVAAQAAYDASPDTPGLECRDALNRSRDHRHAYQRAKEEHEANGPHLPDTGAME